LPTLQSLRADSAYHLGQLMEGFTPGAPRTLLVQQYEAVALHLLTIAVGTLLVDGASQKFFLNLVRAAENGRRFLALLHKRGEELPPASRDVPLLAGLAAGDFVRAGAIAALSRTDRAVSAGEYEVELLWARVLQVLAHFEPSWRGDVEPLLKALPSADGNKAYGERAAAVQAMLKGDRAELEARMVAAATEYGAGVEKRAASFTTPVTSFAPHRFLWLEGLALLRVAERAGIPCEVEVQYCPRLARVPFTEQYTGDWAIAAGVP
jgi:hypothetical protein